MILCIGDIALDVIVLIGSDINYGSDTPSKISTHGGGAAANTAAWLAHSGAQVYLCARVGDDVAGRSVLAELDQFGISHSMNPSAELATGVVVVLVDKTGERTMFPDSGANSGLSERDLPPLDEVTVAHLSGYSLFNPLSTDGVVKIIERLKNKNIPIFFDPASIGTMSIFGIEKVKQYLPLMDGLFLNEEEAIFITGKTNVESALDELTGQIPLVVIKQGSRGSIAKSRGGEIVQLPALELTILDSTGAGDSFAAGFILEWITTRDLATSLRQAIAMASLCVVTIGGRPPVNP